MTAAELPSVTLGRTGLVVSAAGLGCGGHSRLGQQYGATFGESVCTVIASDTAPTCSVKSTLRTCKISS